MEHQPLLAEDATGLNEVVMNDAVLKSKRGRPVKGTTQKTTPSVSKPKKEEDVCFICFDGGSLVLCDRRGCPKAYHPACIKRDEAFFRSKAKWNCGWHICSVCQKASHNMCYTCTYSLCKGCSKTADFVSVRGNKGFCTICMKTITLIENNAQGNNAMCEVDFNDTSSWEYLCKVYWTSLKRDLSLTMDEVLRSKNSRKGAALSCKVGTSHEHYHLKDEKASGSENSCIDTESDNSSNKKPKRSDEPIHIVDGVLNDVGHRTQDLPITLELIGGIFTHQNQINPNDASPGDSSNIGVVSSEASGVALDMSSLLISIGTEQPLGDSVNDKMWHYLDPTGKVQGPFSMLQLYKWKENGHFPSDLRIWRIDEKQDFAVLLTDALDGKCSRNVSLPYNDQMLCLGPSVTSDNKDNSPNIGRIASSNEIQTDSFVIGKSEEQKVDGTCTQSNCIYESIGSNGISNAGQSGNLLSRDESMEYDFFSDNHPNVYPSLPSTAFSDKLLEGLGIEANENHGLNRTSEGQSNSGQSYQKQSESDENSRQSSGHSWECPQVINPVCDASGWLEIFGEPTDGDESVSNLLAEVEAMESLGAGMESTDGSKTDFLSFLGGFSTMLDEGKSDALSSTADLQFPSPSTAAAEPFRQTDAYHNPQRISGMNSSKSSEDDESTFLTIGWNLNNWDPKC